jgi:2-(1,2-epoxy-1,2-dihydrophenyl)acetyl-CoA isomerase
MFGELRDTFNSVAARVDDRVLILTGAGADFCVGADLTERINEPHLAYMRRVADAAMALHRLPQPSVAKVEGLAVGAGCNLALGCDLIVASHTARFSEIFARRGLTLDCGGSWLLPRLVGLHRAKEVALFGDVIDADEALRIGLVNRVVPVSDLDAFVTAWAARLAAGPPLAMSMTKSLLNKSGLTSLEHALEEEAYCAGVNLASADTREAFQAYRERRDPKFQGR